MGEDFDYSAFLQNLQNKYSGERPMDISMGQLFYQPSPTTDEYVAKGFSTSSSGVVGRPSAQNSAQNGMAGMDDLMEAYKAIHEMATGTRGVPLPGSSDIRLHYGASGQRYYTADGSPKEHRDISGNIVKDAPEEGFKLRSGISDRIIDSQSEDTRHSWEKTRINPYAGTSITPQSKTSSRLASTLPINRKQQDMYA
jgi:hypothetical protein